MALYRIEKRFYPTESFVIDFDFDKKKLNVLDETELASLTTVNATDVNATDDEVRGGLFKQIIEAYFASESADEAEKFGNELVHMCVELKSMFEMNTLLVQLLNVGMITLSNDNSLNENWRMCRIAFVHFVVKSEWYKQLAQFTGKIGEDIHYHVKLQPEVEADYEMSRDFMSNMISHPEYRLSSDEAGKCIAKIIDPAHWSRDWVKENPPTINGVPMKEVA